MNYRDDILDNKAFNFFKQLMYNLALAICIMLVGVLILNYGFKYRLYTVETGSEEPFLPVGCMVVVKAQDEYKVGDIITFDFNGTAVTHRLIAIKEENGQKYYICHGDNVQNVDGTYSESGWEDDRDYIESLFGAGKSLKDLKDQDLVSNIQTPTFNQIKGVVLTHIDNYGNYIVYIKDHYLLLITLVVAIWCVSSVAQNEIDLKRSRRLF